VYPKRKYNAGIVGKKVKEDPQKKDIPENAGNVKIRVIKRFVYFSIYPSRLIKRCI